MESRWQRDASVTLRTNVLSSRYSHDPKNRRSSRVWGNLETGTMQRVRHKITIIAVSYGQIRERISASVLPVRTIFHSRDPSIIPFCREKYEKWDAYDEFRLFVSSCRCQAVRPRVERKNCAWALVASTFTTQPWISRNIHKLLHQRNIVGFTVNAGAAFVRDDRSRRRFPRRRRAEQA